MGATLLHSYQCTITESGSGGGTGIVGPNEWNNAHQLYFDLNAQTGTTYTIAATDIGALVTLNNASAVAVTLPVAAAGTASIGSSLGFYKGWFCYVKNVGAGLVTITPTTSTINGKTTLVLSTGQSAFIDSDGVNYTAITEAGIAIRTPVSDAAHSVSGGETVVAYTVITAARIVTLLGAATYAPGTQLLVVDESGSCSASNTISIDRAGSDLINGATSAVISSAYGYICIESNGSNAWTIVDQSTLSMAQQAASAVTISGGTINGATIGGTTPEPGTFTNLTATGVVSLSPANQNVTLSPTGSGEVIINPATAGTMDNLVIGGTTPKAASVTAPAAGDLSARAITSAWFGQSLPGGSVNKFRNPTMDIAQRGTSGTVSSGGTAYTVDGWQVTTAGHTCAWNQEWNSFFGRNALRLNCASGLTACTLQQRIESYIAAQLLTAVGVGQSITVQFEIYNNTGASITPQIATEYPSAQDNFGSTSNDLVATNLQSIANGASGLVAYTFTPSVNAIRGYQIQVLFGGGLNAASGYVDITLADVRVTLGVATGLNSNPPSPEQRPVAAELPANTRYFQTSYGNGVAPGTVTTNGQLSYYNSGGSAVTQVFISTQLQMRAAPTVTWYSPNSGSSGDIYNSSVDRAVSSTTGAGTTTTGNPVLSANLAAGLVGTAHYAASAEL